MHPIDDNAPPPIDRLLKTLRAVALPSLCFAIALVVTWGWRLGGLLARDAFNLQGDDALLPRALLKGLLWDAALVYALFAIARFGAIALARFDAITLGDLTGPAELSETDSTEEAAKKTSARHMATLGILPAGLLAVIGVAMRVLDVGHCYLGQCHWTAEAFMYLNTGMAGFALSARTGGFFALGFLSAVVWILALRRDGWRVIQKLRSRGGESKRTRRLLWASLPLLIAAAPTAWVIHDSVAYPADVYEARLVPEINMVLQWNSLQKGVLCSDNPAYCMKADAGEAMVNDALWSKWRDEGLVPKSSTPSTPFPLLRFGLDEPSLEKLRTPDAVANPHPNVVLTVMESMSGHFISSISGHYQGLTPGLNGLAKKMTSVQGFWNNASPTVNGLVAILCSIHPSTHPSDLGVGEKVGAMAPFKCLPESLRDRGYRTVFIGGFDKTVTSIEFFARTHGFDEVHGRREFMRRFPRRAQGVWGYHDDALRIYAQEEIARLEKLRAKDGRPFLLMMMTLDGHEPGMAPSNFKLPDSGIADLPSDDSSRRQLTSIRYADREVGLLGRFILDTPRAAHTLWVITGDHAMIRTPGARAALFDPKFYGGFAPLPLLIHDPLHRIPRRPEVLSASTDIAPTVLHLLGLGQRPTSMTGLSIFGRRPDHPLIVGRIGTRMVMMADAKGKQERSMGSARRRCKQKEPFFNTGDRALNACELLAFFNWQDLLWRDKRILPPSVFQGAKGVDTQKLARKQAPNKAEQRALRTRKKQPPPQLP